MRSSEKGTQEEFQHPRPTSITAAKKQIAELLKQIKALKNDIETRETDVNALREQNAELLEASRMRELYADKLRSEHATETKAFQDEITHLKNHINELELEDNEEIRELVENLEEVKKNEKNLSSQVKQLNKELEILKEQSQKQKAELQKKSQLEAENNRLRVALEKAIGSRDRFSQQKAEANKKIADLESMVAKLTKSHSQKENLEAQLIEIKSKLSQELLVRDSLEKNKKKLQEDNFKLKGQLSEKSIQADVHMVQLDNLEKRNAQLVIEINKLKAKVSEYQTQISTEAIILKDKFKQEAQAKLALEKTLEDKLSELKEAHASKNDLEDELASQHMEFLQQVEDLKFENEELKFENDAQLASAERIIDELSENLHTQKMEATRRLRNQQQSTRDVLEAYHWTNKAAKHQKETAQRLHPAKSTTAMLNLVVSVENQLTSSPKHIGTQTPHLETKVIASTPKATTSVAQSIAENTASPAAPSTPPCVESPVASEDFVVVTNNSPSAKNDAEKELSSPVVASGPGVSVEAPLASPAPTPVVDTALANSIDSSNVVAEVKKSPKASTPRVAQTETGLINTIYNWWYSTPTVTPAATPAAATAVASVNGPALSSPRK